MRLTMAVTPPIAPATPTAAAIQVSGLAVVIPEAWDAIICRGNPIIGKAGELIPSHTYLQASTYVSGVVGNDLNGVDG